ncbi:MAG TPA: BON domain-containing protein [Ktedonobacterales bacterium]
MPVLTGPARYLFLRREHGEEDVPRWPPVVKPNQWPENQIVTALALSLEEMGWQLGQAELADTEPANTEADSTQAGIRFSRETAFSLTPNGHRNPPVFDLLGVRVVRPSEKSPEYASHLIVRLRPGTGRLLPKDAIVVPIDSLVLAGYFERRNAVDVAAFALRLTPSALGAMPPYLTDVAILQLAKQTVDQAVENPRARHEILLEAESGRVTMLGRAELTSTGDQARSALEMTPGVLEVADHMIYDEDLLQKVTEALEAKGLGYLTVLVEHNLVMLHGEVPDLKSLYKAQDTALAIPGVLGVVVNQLLVVPPVSANGATPAPAATAEASNGAGQQPPAQKPQPAAQQTSEAATSR